MRWEGRRQSDNIEDRRGMRVSRGGLVGGGIGTLAIALLVYFLGGDPTAVLQSAGDAPVQQTNEPYQEGPQEAEWREQTAVTLADTEDIWGKIFADMGGQYRAPTLVLYGGAVDSGCGFAESAMGPFYCPADQKLYIDLAFYQQMEGQLRAGGDFARSYVVAHEVGHHVQNLLGISGQVDNLQQRDPDSANQLSVRLELQADCFAGIYANGMQKYGNVLESGDAQEAINAAKAVGDDTLQRSAGRAVVPDSFTHGSSEQRMRWFATGFKSGSVDACDTLKSADL
ncbi:MAG TPA: neutral zinc metallopeptidase [Steroidobacteraceae bacterium]|jgi:predicted metalloprotease|nr:neutral zinc metallopeptidase [Steroidobacteraceae bacterium]